MLGESRKFVTRVDSQKCKQHIEMFPLEISSQLHLQEIHNSNEGNNRESDHEICQVFFRNFKIFQLSALRL